MRTKPSAQPDAPNNRQVRNFYSKWLLSSSTFIFVLILSVLTVPVLAGTKGIVPGFGNGSAVILQSASFTASARQSDGKLVVTGYLNGQLITARYKADGSPDSSFNKTGIANAQLSGTAFGQSIAIQKDGKIVVAGTAVLSEGSHGQIMNPFVVMLRYNTDGSLDNSFDGDGFISTTNGIGGYAFQIIVQSDAKIVLAGKTGTLMRFNADGSRDQSTFDQSFEFGTSLANTFIAAIAVQQDDKILELRSDSNLILLRYNRNGSRDSSFNGNGLVVTDFGGYDNASSIVIQPDGKIVVSGDTYLQTQAQRVSVLARYNQDGSPDLSFGVGGKVIAEYDSNATFTETVSNYFQSGSLEVQSNGNIISTKGALTTRYNPDGTLDKGFYSVGKLVLDANVLIRSTLIIDNNLYLAGEAKGSPYGGYLYAVTLDNTVRYGLNYRYYEGEWNTLPDFSTLIPVQTGVSIGVDLSTRPAGRDDRFAYVWEGYINIPTPGNYTFETTSDDGSKFYFNTFYSPSATALVTNEGVHAPTSVQGSVDIPVAGLYPITITYFEKDGGQAMELYWSGPGLARQLVPKTAFTLKVIDNVLPSIPANLRLMYKGRTFARLDWEDATDNVGVAVYEVYGNGTLLATTTSSYGDIENLNPATSYNFTVKAVDAAGNKSGLAYPVDVTTASSGLAYKFYKDVPYGVPGLQSLMPFKTGTTGNVDLSIRQGVNENYAFLWQGYINIPAAGTYTFETVSDDGSRVYFNMPFSDVAVPLVDNFENNGLHAPVSASGTVKIPSAGLYPIAITYHQYGGGQSMQLYWQGPGISRQLIPDAAFANDTRPGFLVNGLNYKYYEGNWTSLPDFTALTPVKTGQTPNVDLSVRTPGREDQFAFVWEGYITLPLPGGYTFEIISDDGSKLYFNSQYVPTSTATINNDGLHAAQSVKASINVTTPGTFPIAITYFENTGDQKMQVYWTGPNIQRQLIPTEVLSPNPPQQMERLSYAYYEGTWGALPDFTPLIPVKTGTGSDIDISVRPTERNDNFAFVWKGYIYLPQAGTYNFETVSDDGSRFYFWNTPAVAPTVDNDGIHAARSATSTIITGAGIYPFVVTYFELSGAETMELYWTGPGIARQRIPKEAFVLVNPDAIPAPIIAINAVAQKPATVDQLAATQMPNSYSVYPNPFDNNFAVNFYNSYATDDINVGIYDLSGKRVFMNHVGKLPAGDNMININLNSLKIKDGVYVLQLQKNGFVWKTEKMVKLKKIKRERFPGLCHRAPLRVLSCGIPGFIEINEDRQKMNQSRHPERVALSVYGIQEYILDFRNVSYAY